MPIELNRTDLYNWTLLGQQTTVFSSFKVMTMAFLSRAALLYCLCICAYGVTLEEGLNDPKKYIFYDLCEFLLVNEYELF